MNAASFAPSAGPGHELTPGSLATIFGQNLAASAAQAPGYPLPRTLNGTTVLVNGLAAPLLYVSPQQINLQVPVDTADGSRPVQVVTASGTSDAVQADVGSGVGIFTLNGSGCGPGAVLNVRPDSVVSINSSSNSAAPGDYLVIYSTGIGRYYDDGTPAAFTGNLFGVQVGIGDLNALSRFSGVSPQYAGVVQANVQVPPDTSEGCAVPINLFRWSGSGDVYLPETPASQYVTVSIRAGGGSCMDPPLAALGSLVLERAMDVNTGLVQESLSGEFPTSPGRRVRQEALQQTTIGPVNNRQGPHCAIPGLSKLNAGAVSVGTTTVQPSADPDGVRYQASLPAGTLKSGNSVQVSSQGGPTVGAFEAAVKFPDDLTFTTSYPPGTHLYRGDITSNPLIVKWTGGQAGQIVTAALVSHQLGYDEMYQVQARAEVGEARIERTAYLASYPFRSMWAFSLPPGAVEIVVTLSPDPAVVQRVAAGGVSLGVAATWRYVYRFPGILMP